MFARGPRARNAFQRTRLGACAEPLARDEQRRADAARDERAERVEPQLKPVVRREPCWRTARGGGRRWGGDGEFKGFSRAIVTLTHPHTRARKQQSPRHSFARFEQRRRNDDEARGDSQRELGAVRLVDARAELRKEPRDRAVERAHGRDAD